MRAGLSVFADFSAGLASAFGVAWRKKKKVVKKKKKKSKVED